MEKSNRKQSVRNVYIYIYERGEGAIEWIDVKREEEKKTVTQLMVAVLSECISQSMHVEYHVYDKVLLTQLNCKRKP